VQLAPAGHDTAKLLLATLLQLTLQPPLPQKISAPSHEL
jgi:hypothetical protein